MTSAGRILEIIKAGMALPKMAIATAAKTAYKIRLVPTAP
jgi:hypothetical protein